MSGCGLSWLLRAPPENFTWLQRQAPSPPLPEGVLAAVIQHLGPRDVLSCRLVSKAWSRAAAAAVRRLDVPCKTLAAAAAGGGRCGPDVALRELHRLWPAVEAMTLSGLAAGRALHREMSLQLLANHLSRWRNLRELYLKDMPVQPAPLEHQLRPHAGPRSGEPHSPPGAGAGGAAGGGAGGAGESRGGGGGGPGRRRDAGGSSGGGSAVARSSGGGSSSSGGGGGPGPWGLGCLSCCLGLTRLEIELVPAKEPSYNHPNHRDHDGRLHPHHSPPNRHHRRHHQQHHGSTRRSDPAQLAAGQVAVLEGLTRLTKLHHLAVRLLDLPPLALPAPPPPPPGVPGVGGPAEGAGRGAAAVAVSIRSAGDEAEEYLLDAEDAGDFGADLDLEVSELVRESGTPERLTAGVDVAPDANVDADVDTADVDGADVGAADADAAGISRAADQGVGRRCRRRRGAEEGGLQGEEAGSLRNQNTRGQQRQQQHHQQHRPAQAQTAWAAGDDVVVGGGVGVGGDGDVGGGGGIHGGGVGDDGGDDGGAVLAPWRPSSQWIPHPALFERLGPRLRSLRLSGCVLRGGGALALLAGALPGLTSLSLQGRLGVSHQDLEALGALRQLQDLSLSRVELLYEPRDPDDCPVALMTELYGALQQLPKFESLRFELDAGGGTGIHSAYLLALYESPLPRLSSLSLATVVLDSDYSFHLLAELTSLTSLSLSYTTWPLALESADMTLLAPLSGLRRFHMHCVPSERHHLIALSGRVTSVLARAWPHLTQLHFTGQIRPDSPHAPSLASLASWTSLRDISLTAAPDDDDDNEHRAAAAAAAYLSLRNANARGAAFGGSAGEAGTRAGAARGPCLYGDFDDEEEEEEGGPLDLGIGWCLPTGLTRLALSGVRLRAGELCHLATSLTGLTSLQVLDCGLAAEHLMVADMGAKQLQVLVLNDSRPWRACRSTAPPSAGRRRPAAAAATTTATGAAGSGVGGGASGGASYGPSSPLPCSCCCAPDIWAPSRCVPFAGCWSRGGPGEAQRRSSETRKPNEDSPCPVGSRPLSKNGSSNGGSRSSGDGVGDCGSSGRCGEETSDDWSTDGWDVGAEGAGAAAASVPGEGAGCRCWRRRLVQRGLATLGSMRSLEFLLLGLPDEDLAAWEALRPLVALTGLRCLTLQARGLRAAAPWEVAELLGGLTRLRSLHLTGPRPGSAAAQGAVDAARCLPYLSQC